MTQIASKKVWIERFDREAVAGFVQGVENGPIEVLRPEGSLVQIPRSEAKAVCFVRDFENPLVWKPNRAFQARPKIEGLWLRLRFRDGDTMEGLVSNNLLGLEAGGFSIVPPDALFHNQRIFVPSEALLGADVLGVIGTPLRRKAKPTSPDADRQIPMFG